MNKNSETIIRLMKTGEAMKNEENTRNIQDFDLKNTETISQIRALFDIVRTLSENLNDRALAVGLSSIADSGNRMILSAMTKELEKIKGRANNETGK